MLATMPEHFVDDICNFLNFNACMAPKEMSSSQSSYGNVFNLVVKLLLLDYAKVVRNYNLRAKYLYIPTFETTFITDSRNKTT